MMADGKSKNIEDILIGEQLLGADGFINTVLDYHRPVLKENNLYSINGGAYFVTDSHPFMTTKGWKSISPDATHQEMPHFEVDTLHIGDMLITFTGIEEIYAIEKSQTIKNIQLYNFIVNGNNTYYANGYLVHNKTETTICSQYSTSTTCMAHGCPRQPAVPEVLGTCQAPASCRQTSDCESGETCQGYSAP
jgi:hypothetical protein